MSDGRRKLWLALLLCVGILPFELNGWYDPLLSPRAFWIVDFTSWIILPVAIACIALRMGLFTLDTLGFHSRVWGRSVAGLLPAVVIVFAFAAYHLDRWAVEAAPRLFPINYLIQPFQYRDLLPPPGPETGGWRLLGALYFAASAGFIEEIYYRAMMSRLFPRGRLGSCFFVVMGPLVFASVHWEGGVQEMFEAGVFGFVAATCYRATDNIWPSVIAHAIIDFLWFK